MPPVKIKTKDIEIAVAEWLGVRQQRLIVPNVSWGLGIHECDILTVSHSGYASEIEIKVSKSDLCRDAHKHHQHRSQRIKYLYFAMPASMCEYEADVPTQAGIILVDYYDFRYQCTLTRRPTPNKLAKKFTDAEMFTLARLGALRIWSLKRRVLELERRCISCECDYSI